MRQLQNDPEKIRFFYQKPSLKYAKNHRSKMPPDSASTYGLINIKALSFHKERRFIGAFDRLLFLKCDSCRHEANLCAPL